MKITYHIPLHNATPDLKRGDLLQSNIGDKRERTWLILAVKRVADRTCKEMGGILTRRHQIWAERWWELEPKTRLALFKSAERAGAQELFGVKRFPAKRKAKTLEQYVGAR